MRIGLDCRVLNQEKQRAGVANYVYQLVKNILVLNGGSAPGGMDAPKDEYVLFWQGSILPEFAELAGVRHAVLPAAGFPLATSHWRTAKIMDSAGLDLMHFPAGPVPAVLRTPYILTVHDLAIFRHPEWFPYQPLSRILTPRSWRRAAGVIAVSKFTESELYSMFKLSAGRVAVIYEGVDRGGARAPAKETGHDPYFLFLGTLEPRKNVSRLIKAFAKVRVQFPSAELLLAGRPGWKCAGILEQARTTRGVSMLGYISEEQKFSLLASASALVYPSLYEGFGLPVLEAMALGCPVITSNSSALREIADDAALFVDPVSTDEIMSAMTKILADPQLADSLKQKGRVRAASFSWKKTAGETVAFYKKIALKNQSDQAVTVSASGRE